MFCKRDLNSAEEIVGHIIVTGGSFLIFVAAVENRQLPTSVLEGYWKQAMDYVLGNQLKQSKINIVFCLGTVP
jgi:hypothetical protein